ncbi:MAG TPA: STAS/SEC14 domain-containing protein [Pelobium sp.]|nr:STAS/SEC14 domain-containing protein [Pelobium sp.]
MLNIIQNLPDHVVGVEAVGEVTADDLKNILLPALEQNAKKYDGINYLLVLRTEVKNWTAGAWIQDMLAGIKNFTKWNKIAVVTDEKFVEKFTDGFSFITPGKAKGFKLNEEELAKSWVSEA